MEEIKFRGKTIDDKTWVYGDLITKRNNSKWIHFYDCNDFECEYEVISETVGQFSGLRDNKGIAIYKNDIVRRGYSNNNGYFYHNGYIVYVENDGAFEIADSTRYLKRLTVSSIAKWNITVIGDMWDNPELMKDE